MKSRTIALFFCFSSFVFSQTSPQDLVKTFFTIYQTDKEKAVRDLYGSNEWTQTNKKIVDDVVEVVKGLSVINVGKYNGYELIDSKKITPNFEVFSFLLKYDRQPVRFLIKLYKPNQKWILYTFKIDEAIEDGVENFRNPPKNKP